MSMGVTELYSREAIAERGKTLYNDVNIAIIIPVYNEEKRIKHCLEHMYSYCNKKNWNFELIFAEDGSDDKTVNIIDTYAHHLQTNRIRRISSPSRVGKGASIRNALNLIPSDKDLVAYMDADLSAHPSEIQRLIDNLGDCDLVLGSRILHANRKSVKRPIYRSFFSHLYSIVFRTLFRITIYDPQCGLKLFKTTVVNELIDGLEIDGFAFDTELIIRANVMGLRIKEVPIKWTHIGGSKINIINEVRRMGQDVIGIWYKYHLLWLDKKLTYPQKKGSIKGRLLFALLKTDIGKFIRKNKSASPINPTNIA